jgi:hypothetical protein
MSSIERAETLLRLLDLDDAFRASRPNGYAYARIVDVEHAADMPPDTLVLAIDPLARLERADPESPRRRQDRQQPFRRNTRQTGSIQSGSDRPGQPLVRAESGPYLPTHRISGSLHRPGAGKGGIVGMSGSSPGTRQTTKGALGPPLHPAGEGRHGQVGQAPFSFAPRRRSAPAPTVGWSSNPAQILGQRFAPQEVRRSPSLHDRAGSPLEPHRHRLRSTPTGCRTRSCRDRWIWRISAAAASLSRPTVQRSGRIRQQTSMAKATTARTQGTGPRPGHRPLDLASTATRSITSSRDLALPSLALLKSRARPSGAPGGRPARCGRYLRPSSSLAPRAHDEGHTTTRAPTHMPANRARRRIVARPAPLRTSLRPRLHASRALLRRVTP